MLSVASVRSASGAANYFAKDDYYTADGSAEVSGWAGEGADALGLSGEVSRDSFEGILNGKLPDGNLVGQVENRQSGMDLTFSMPKSASVMAYVAGDKRVLDANMAAVRATMKWVEANLAEGRKDVDGKKVPFRTGNLVYALFQHDTSRALDPQAHIHAVIANLTRMPDGKWQALHNGEIWRSNSVIGSIYHAFLREGLEKLGYQIELRGKHGTFEIAGVPKAILEAFSQRREEIVAKAGALGISSPQGMREVTTRTRDPKLNVEDRDDLRAGWIDKAARLGFDGKALLEAAVARAQRAPPGSALERGYRAVSDAIGGAWEKMSQVVQPGDPLVDRGLARLTQSPAVARTQLAVASAVRILAQREAAFNVRLLTKTAVDLGLKGVTAETVERRVAALLEKGALVPEAIRRNDGALHMVTTPLALHTEEQILSRVEAGKGLASAIVPAADAPDRLQAAAGRPLNAGQLAAATMILSAPDRTVIVQGIAGAGKSTMLQSVARVAEAEGRTVLGLAFQNKMVADLADGAGIKAQTIASFVIGHEKHLANPQGPHFEEARALLAGTMLVVDETSMVSSDDMLKLQKISALMGVDKLVLVGDRQQLSSIDAGKSFALIQAGGGTMARMDENIRQRTDQLRTVAALANIGQAGQALKVLGEKVIEHDAPAEHAAERWLALSPEDRAATAVFASGREARTTINEEIQKGLAAEGTLRGESIRLTVYERVNLTREELRYPASYRAGQTVEVGRGGAPDVGLRPGRFDVLKVQANGRIEISDGRRRHRIDPQKITPGERRDQLMLTERKELTLREGDRIRWTANDKDRGLHNAALARIVAVSRGGVTVETAARETLTLAPGDPMLSRLDLAYALNMHMAQGITTDRAITVMSSYERNLSNQRLFNVGVTRVRDDLTLIVDDKDKLTLQLDTNPGNKTSALETVGRLEIDRPKETSSGKGATIPFDPGPLPAGSLSPLPADLPPLKGDEARAGVGAQRTGAGLGGSTEGRAGPDLLPPLPERSLGLDL
ncbi:MobF family relaxase [Sphingomonas sp. NPDC019816]|uniref:MobF family relaxase n=2 Tax=Pseudomonadota TaxID=1224 RepID=UPI000F7D649F|nr:MULTISPECIES: MobF family relaxase [Alphaproteobacteria]RSV14018.1 conjugative relaxase [Sphingomonas sp. ABOLF]TAJ29218.1 MAG: conjugative relaxase [Bosea sp. (in: a-proteobacteria)]